MAAVEGINQIVTGNLTTLSEQQLIDCDSMNNGCSGGLMANAFSFIASGGGLYSEEDYPYLMEEGTCDGMRVSLSLSLTDARARAHPYAQAHAHARTHSSSSPSIYTSHSNFHSPINSLSVSVCRNLPILHSSLSLSRSIHPSIYLSIHPPTYP